MYSNNIANFQESTRILNACTKKSGNLLNAPRTFDFKSRPTFPAITIPPCRYETIEEIKAAVTKIIDMLTQEEFHVAFQKLLERYNKCIAAGGDYFEGD